MKTRTLEELENDYWEQPAEFPTPLVEKCFHLRKKPIGGLSSEDIRILIGQNIGLKYLIPIAISLLQSDILVQACFYPGDLLFSVLKSENSFWRDNLALRLKIIKLIEINKDIINNSAKINAEIRQDINMAYSDFIG